MNSSYRFFNKKKKNSVSIFFYKPNKSGSKLKKSNLE